MIEGKVIAITGASSGIGEATALHLAQRGANLILGARREEGLARLTAAIEAAGGHASYKVTDVSKRDDLHDLMVDIYIHHLFPVVHGKVVKWADWHRAGVAEQHINSAVLLLSQSPRESCSA